ncbi:MAG: hypothetical protein ACI9OJ_000906 [Myxococcota bacterium]|jgi:hypothetical protein
MRQLVTAVLVAFLAIGCSSSSGSDGTSGSDSDATTGTDGTDATSATTGTDATDATAGTDGTDTTGCTPECTDKACGDDGCGGSCGDCPTGENCKSTNQCGDAGCDPFCINKVCGDDGCGGNCGMCPAGDTCNAQGTCDAPCQPQCAGKTCGDDACGGSCGECTGGQLCTNSGNCVDPGDLMCGTPADGQPEGGCIGDDPCSCAGCIDDGACGLDDDCVCPECAADGFCGDANNCNGDGSCDPYNEGCACTDCATHPLCGGECTPECDGLTCGDDGCGGSCGDCTATEFCAAGTCEACTCDGKSCGDDGCGVSCGECGADELCGFDFTCSDTTGLGCGQATAPDTGCLDGNMCQCLGCVNDGVCDPATDDCLCPDCAEDAFCADPINCDSNESCDPWSEGCGCSDCVLHPVCPECEPKCDGKTCGDDGCGGVCGECTDTEFCDEAQACEACTCDGKNCGEDGCGTVCGECTGTEYCDPTQTCLAIPEGDGCAAPFTIAAGATMSGNTSTALDLFSVTEGLCGDAAPFGGDGIGDHVYAFTPETAGVYTFTLTGDYNVAYTILSGACDAQTCMATSSVGDEQKLALDAATTYYIMVEGAVDDFFGGETSGAYDLTISAACVPACDGKTCGSDGCGINNCGECTEGMACDATQNCTDPAAVAGATCGNPFAIEALPFTTTGDNTGGYNIYSADTCGSGGGADAPDQAYSFTPAADGAYTISVTTEGDAGAALMFYVTTDCAFGEDACIDFGTDSAPVQLTADTPYFIIVDGTGATEIGAYTIAVDACVAACTDKTCGSDSCGGTCGECADGTACVETEAAAECIAPTCEGACGGEAAAGGCFCDGECAGFGDCCTDICDFCAEEDPENCGGG